jgi:uncharacterized OB-fold protein
VDLQPPELIYLEGETRCTYSWATGDVVGAFLGALRDHGKILGSACEGCGDVMVPPQSYCEKCGAAMGDFREVGPRGVVMSWAGVTDDLEGAPLRAPFRYVLVRLAGADSELLHVAPDDERIRIGATVRPEFKPESEREGSIRDIKWFVADVAEGER